MKKKNIGLLFYILSAIFNVTAIVMFAGGNESGTGAMWLCLGAAFLCLGSHWSMKAGKEAEKNEGPRKD